MLVPDTTNKRNVALMTFRRIPTWARWLALLGVMASAWWALTLLPSSAPEEPSALCRDGTYSYSQHRQGTCSWHGGVRQWLRSIPAR